MGKEKFIGNFDSVNLIHIVKFYLFIKYFEFFF